MKDSGIEWIGEIPDGWDVKRIKYVTDIIMGQSPDSDDVFLDEEGFPFMQGNAEFTNLYPVTHNYCNCPPKLSRIGDILMSVRAPVGELNISDKVYGIGRGLCSIKAIVINDKFLWFTLFALKDKLSYYSNGSTFDAITTKTLLNVPISLPSINEQAYIGEFLSKKCSAIDKSIELQKSSIKKLQEYKKAIITEAVTKGLNSNVTMKDSGIEWIGEIPEHWEAARLKNLFILQRGYDLAKDEFVDAGIPVYGSNGIIGYHNIAISKAPNVTIGRSGSIGEVNYIQDDFWPHNTTIFIKNINQNNVKYIYYILCSIDIKNLGSGSAVPTLDRKNIQNFFCPYTTGVAEQQAIAAYLDQKCSTVDKIIVERQDLIEKLTEYKKSLIYEVVTGKMEMPVADSNIIQFPAIFNSNKKRFVQATLMSKILDSFGNEVTGRVKLEKTIFTIEHHIGFDFDTSYKREIAGPLDGSIYECEGIISKRNKWFSIQHKNNSISYRPTKEKDKYKQYYNKYFNQYNREIERIIAIFKPFTMDQAEIIATLYAAWNDAIIKGENFTDKDIVRDVTNNWKDTKRRFADDVWLRAMDKMREFALVPKGYGKPTQRVIGKRNKSPKAKEENS
ncbi:hypothetical protein AGMMS4952_05690 [Spirochaetia bacterium]|nr:hypothetical protein AGMMS4952_05690 [Spirochaetia bacterium]